MVPETNETGYGTIQEPSDINSSSIAVKPDTGESFVVRLKLRIKSEVNPRKTYLVLIGLFFVTGLVDSAAYNIWSCFVSMQTGMEQSTTLAKFPQRESSLDRKSLTHNR